MTAPYRAPEPVPLGPLVHAYRWRHSGPLIVCGLFFLAPLIGIPFAIQEGFAKYNVVSYFGLALAFVGMPVGGIAILLAAYRLAGNYVRIHQDGLEHRWRNVETRARWEDIVSITSKVTQRVEGAIAGPVMHTHTVKLKNGRTLVITHGYAEIDQLVAELRERSFSVLAHDAERRFRDEEEVSFGPLRVSRARGVIGPKGVLPWSDVDGIAVDEGEVKVLQRSPKGPRPWVTIDLGKIPNAEVLVALIERGQQTAS